ncbi:tyrosine-type recombinase/integrase [Bradyrhizobium japonicum]|uniref:tyrosine-type recombinase/integrase n=1 Tax=Bradyrhizobium japonicum TaxID=375 RepID=UPI0004B44F87|nr:site-specific integrase [Bradyrhizobium japonicum]
MLPAQHKRAAAFIKNLKATDARQEVPDDAVSGLYLIVQPSGALSWAVRTKLDGKAAKVTLGRYDEEGSGLERIERPSSKQVLNITEARALAARVKADAKRGHDPRESKTERFSLEYWLDEFTRAARSTGFKGRPVKASTADEYDRIIKTDIKPHWKHVTDIRTLDYRDVKKLIEKLPPGAQRNAFALLSTFFRWKAVIRTIGKNVIELADPPPKPQSRHRVLSHDEIKAVWNAATACDYPFGALVKLLLLTGQRRDEIANLKWSELSDTFDTITFEGSRTKNGRAHIVPLPQLATTIIKGLAERPRVAISPDKMSDYVFTTIGTTPFSGFSNGKIALEKHCDPALPDWHLHDLRRTVSTELAKLRVTQEVTEAILNHKTGKVSGVAAIYNRYEYADEKREALNLWADRLEEIIKDRPRPKLVASR